ncbi:hypothetical protein K450DRAFT_231757 [Umbelopsis ramanniana AG]|uniref:Uncharacterized protein n=1 Tax=Umbelopsis ramanniana AG TaxID=1314678 RepID=A0AAD5EEM4_UMBRA|nr:uncharacterized protein K450DRAFT_231757 [Umbelopsis ramanniana AG]KAI8581531.1 hypothetical protein K450DRAFT_231757 [Umbelopsis ramanniana AG]
MQIIVGFIIAFSLGYLTSQYGLFGSVIEEFVDVTLSSNKRGIILVVAGLILSYIFILIPLERIASIESKRSEGYPFRTSAREHLQRRGSF